MGRDRSLVGALAALSAVAGLVHLAFTHVHFEQSWTHGLFFATVAAAQLGWGAAAMVRPQSRPLLAAAAAGNTAVAAVWAISRATGSEPVGLADGLCTGIELVLVGTATALLVRPASGLACPHWATAGITTFVLALAAVAVTPVLTGHDHDHDDRSLVAAAAGRGRQMDRQPRR